jgi:carbon starvation protein
MIILLAYAFIASVLPVWRLLQPRDYINGHELFVVLFILTAAVFVSHPAIVAPAVNLDPDGAPPIWPFLFITIACGAISGFHSLVGSGTTSKQLSRESHALTIGYGGMLMEGALATLVIMA